MKRFAAINLAMLSTAGLLFAGSAMAEPTQRIDNRQEKQEQRIDQGISSGRLNEHEAQRLDKQQNHIDKMENKALSDGKLSAKERAHIEHAQDKQNRRIARQKHDRHHDYNHNGKGDRHERHQHRGS